ncbi:MAG TPA: hypothetical protein VNH13_02685 [Candidatus Acidoferrales bacterium]|nr:hypothetical protein [Candidatus Acidoferrales bacterium]
MSRTRLRSIPAIAAAVALALASAAPAAAHTEVAAGPYAMAIGWHVEPAYVGVLNGVEVTVTDGAGKPVEDIGPSDLAVIVSTAGQDSQPLSFEPGFDPAEGTGTAGQYVAALLPTAPGAYTFHVTGSIHGAAVDATLSSSDATFDPVSDTAAIEFPVRLPSAADIATHLERIDGRIVDLQGGVTGAQVRASASAAAAAQASADRATLLAAVLGLVSVVVAGIAVALAVRARRGARPA